MASILSLDCIYISTAHRWLMLKNRETEAREVLQKFVSSNDVESIEDDIADIKESLNEHTDPNCLQELRLMMKWKNLRR